jgi:serpin B
MVFTMKRLILILTAGALILSLASCAADSGNPAGKVFAQLDLEAAPLLATDWEKNYPEISTNDFALKLSAELAKSADGENFVCSPFSVWLPLAALVNGTDSAHKTALLEALGAKGISEKDLNEYASRTLYALTNERRKVRASGEYYNPLRIANAIFVDNDVTLKRDFAQKFLDFYRGAGFNVDFQSKDAVKKVNKWASDNTDGLITDIIQEFDPQTVAAIANAIYFSDRWTSEFNAANTKRDTFHAAGGDTTADFMLRQGDAQIYYEDDRVQAMPLSFQSGGSLYIILPKDGDATGFLQSLRDDYFQEIQRDSISATGKLLLPKFEMDSGLLRLDDALQTLGVPLFDSETAPLTKGILEEDIPVWVGSAVQKAYIKVDEKGATAAAVTALAMSGAAMSQPTEPFEMKCDKPFVFVLTGNSGDVLFTGVVNLP